MAIYSILATELFREIGHKGRHKFFQLPDASLSKLHVTDGLLTTRSGEFGKKLQCAD